MKKDYKLLMETAMLAGELMLKSGAETYRTEDTMKRILETSGLQKVEAYVTVTGMMATMNDETLTQPMTAIYRVSERGTCLYRVMRVNAISRDYCSGKLSLEDAYAKLSNMPKKQYSILQYNLAIICIAFGFAMFSKGTLTDVLAAAVAGTALSAMITVCKRLKMNAVIYDIITSMSISASVCLLMEYVWPSINMDIVIISAMMPLVPGVAITNAIRDTLQGDYVSGGARMLEAFLKAAAIALGVGVGLAVMGNL